MNDMKQFLAALGRHCDESISVCHLAGGAFVPVITTVTGAPGEVARHADRDCWYGTAALHPRVTSGRGAARDVIGVREVFADLDVKPGGRRRRRRPGDEPDNQPAARHRFHPRRPRRRHRHRELAAELAQG